MATKSTLIKFFNKAGFVFDFSNANFQDFCEDTIGINIQRRYNLSKGASLNEFLFDKTISTKVKYDLFKALTDYFENWKSLNKEDFENNKHIIKIMKKEVEDVLGQYIQDQEKLDLNIYDIDHQTWNLRIKYLENALEKGFSEQIIGKLKELFETFFKTYLNYKKVDISDKPDFTKLVKLSFEIFDFLPDEKDYPVANRYFKNFKGLISKLGELRNSNGDGHGKILDVNILDSKYAEVIVKSLVPILNFLVEQSNIETLKIYHEVDKILWS